ncbi:MAG: serine acetyltransferase [Deltaproteobacteria bacterium HGW-Deltaproteobacteria-13]|jgi:serine O-acetyltransferase|nr:MAG: serine acetyltransferase [Deltaproteobacteria bacterium HGW-Deltaproteobacteria-13]
MKRLKNGDKCKNELKSAKSYRDEVPDVVDKLVASCASGGCFDHVSAEPIPHREAIIDVLHRLALVLYPGYFIRTRLDSVNLEYYLGQQVTALYETLSEQIILSIRHDCIRHNQSCVHCEPLGHQLTVEFLRKLPELRTILAKDIRAALEGDPAAKGYDEIIFSYPGIRAITIYRIAHELYHLKVPLMPRIMTEYAHSRTGIDIHPGAHIGESFFIDHGTGVVIGETCVIGNRVRIYQGVTLGAISLSKAEVKKLRSQKRHPSIEDDVIIYANATILGGETIVGARSVIGGNVWLTHSVPPDTEVFIKKQDLIFGAKQYKKQAAKQKLL